MRITTDDSLRRIDSRWLGPPGFTFPWSATRYVAYGVGTPIVAISVLISTRLFGEGFWQIVYAVCIGVWITTRVMSHVDDERPALGFPGVLWAEITAPRGDGPNSRPHSHTVDLAGIVIFPVVGGLLREAAAAPKRAEHERQADVHQQGPQGRPTHDPAPTDRGTRRADDHPRQRLVPAPTRSLELSA